MSDKAAMEGAFGGSQESRLGAKLEAFRREMRARFNLLTVLIVGSAVVIFFKDYLG